MENLSIVKAINFFNKINLNEKSNEIEAKKYFSKKEIVLYLLNNIEMFPNLSASYIYKLCPFIKNENIAYLSISKDIETLKYLPKELSSNKQFMTNIAHISNANGIFYIDDSISNDENLIKTYIEEIFINDRFDSFPKELSKNKILNKTYKRILKQIATNNDYKKSFIEYFKNLEYLYYNIANAYNRKLPAQNELDQLDRLTNKIQQLADLIKETVMENGELNF